MKKPPKKKKPKNKFKKEFKIVASIENMTEEEIYKEIEILIADAYNSGSTHLHSITKDGSMPTTNEFLDYLFKEIKSLSFGLKTNLSLLNNCHKT